jgi:hypothetical protein
MKAPVCFVACLFAALLASVAALHAAEPAAPAAPPKTVKLGAYVMSLYDLNSANNTFTAEFWLWALHAKSLELKPLKTIETENARDFRTSLETTEDHGDVRYHAQKVRGVFNHNWNVGNFPFDRHELRIRLSEGQEEAPLLAYAADAANAGFDPEARIEGWRIEKVAVTTGTRKFESSFGEPESSGGSAYAQAVVSIFVARDALGLFVKLHAAVYVAFLVSLVAFFMDMSKDGLFTARISLLVGMIFATVLNTQRIAGTLGQSSAFTLADKIHIVTLLALLLGLLATLLSRRLHTTNRSELAFKVDRRLAAGLAAFYLAVNAAMIGAAAHAG